MKENILQHYLVYREEPERRARLAKAEKIR